MLLDDMMAARALHILGVVLWIGGVAMETTVLMPLMRRMSDSGGAKALFDKIEKGFVWQARITTLIVGATGFYMLGALDGWSRYTMASQWWLHAMTIIWALFTIVLFVLEPLMLHKWFDRRFARDASGTLALVHRLHWILLGLSLLTVAAATAGAHGAVFFG